MESTREKKIKNKTKQNQRSRERLRIEFRCIQCIDEVQIVHLLNDFNITSKDDALVNNLKPTFE